MGYQRRVTPFVRGTIYDVRQPRTCPKCGGVMERGDRMVADTDDRTVHYDPPCKGDPAPLPVIPRFVEPPRHTYGQDWPSLPWHYIAGLIEPSGYKAVCGQRLRAVREGARVIDALGWPTSYRCANCERLGPPKWRMVP